jgi:hypothetical protein
VTGALTLDAGDEIAVSARRGAFPDIERMIGREIDAPDLLAVPLTPAALVVTSRLVAHRSDLRAGAGHQ